jgi:hypothetical protein
MSQGHRSSLRPMSRRPTDTHADYLGQAAEHFGHTPRGQTPAEHHTPPRNAHDPPSTRDAKTPAGSRRAVAGTGVTQRIPQVAAPPAGTYPTPPIPRIARSGQTPSDVAANRKVPASLEVHQPYPPIARRGDRRHRSSPDNRWQASPSPDIGLGAMMQATIAKAESAAEIHDLTLWSQRAPAIAILAFIVAWSLARRRTARSAWPAHIRLPLTPDRHRAYVVTDRTIAIIDTRAKAITGLCLCNSIRPSNLLSWNEAGRNRRRSRPQHPTTRRKPLGHTGCDN